MFPQTVQRLAARVYPGATLGDTRQTFFSDLVFATKGNGESRVVKHVLPRGSETRGELCALADATDVFSQKLRHLGVAVPNGRFMFIGEQLVMASHNVGPDLGVVLQGCVAAPDKVYRYLVELVRLIAGPLLQEQACPDVGLDLQLSNIGTANGQLWYLDTFPPLVRTEKGLWVHWPQPTVPAKYEEELERKFRRIGTLRRLRYDIMKLRPDFDTLFEKALIEVLGEVGHEICAAFAALPDSRIGTMSLIDAEALIGGLGTGHKDLLRELSVRLLPTGGNRAAYMHRMFCLSRADPSPGYEEPFVERVEMLKAWLIKELRADN